MPRRHTKIKSKKSFPWIWVFISTLILVLVGGGIWWSQSPTESGPGESGPRLAFDQEKVDLGRQPLDKTVRAQFKITNTGDRTLTLDASAPVRAIEGC